MSAWLGGGQPKLCRASLSMSLVQTQASLIFFNRNIWWNPMMGVFISLELAHNHADGPAVGLDGPPLGCCAGFSGMEGWTISPKWQLSPGIAVPPT